MAAGLDWESVSVRVEPVANGFLVIESKSGASDYRSAQSERLFYPTLDAVERELLIRFRAAIALDISNAKEDF